MLGRLLILLYGIASYALFFATFLYAIGFIGNLWVPKSIDALPGVPLWQALLTNLGLLGLFAVQHSVMARPAFKRWWTRIVPEPAERSTYVLLSSLALIALFVYWQPMGGVVWNVESPLARGLIHGVYALGWALILLSTFLINHFDLFGLRQVWLRFRGVEYAPVPFEQPWLYTIVRHPLMLGFLLAFWAAPTLTQGHLLFSLATTGYILVGIVLEERDLVKAHGQSYVIYTREVRMLLPIPRRPSR